MLLLTAARGAGEAGWSVLTHHQHKHTEVEEGRGDDREREREREREEERRGEERRGVLYKTQASQL